MTKELTPIGQYDKEEINRLHERATNIDCAIHYQGTASVRFRAIWAATGAGIVELPIPPEIVMELLKKEKASVDEQLAKYGLKFVSARR